MNNIVFSNGIFLKASAGAFACAMEVPQGIAAARPTEFPDRPIRFIVPFGTGGVLDVLALGVADFQEFFRSDGAQSLGVSYPQAHER